MKIYLIDDGEHNLVFGRDKEEAYKNYLKHFMPICDINYLAVLGDVRSLSENEMIKVCYEEPHGRNECELEFNALDWCFLFENAESFLRKQGDKLPSETIQISHQQVPFYVLKLLKENGPVLDSSEWN